MKKLLTFLFLLTITQAQAQMQGSKGDINYFTNFSSFHDSVNCASIASETYLITIANSFIGDSVVLKDQNNGQILAFAVNTNGMVPWSVNLFPNIIIPYISDEYLNGGSGIFPYFTNVKIISGPDTISNIFNVYNTFVANPCTYNTVSGKIFIDNNNDCIYNTGDDALNNISVVASGILSLPVGNNYTRYGYSSLQGDYSINLQQNYMTSYNTTLPSYFQFIFPISSCNPISYTTSSLPQANNNFALQSTVNVDAAVFASAPSTARPLIPFMLHPMVSNTGADSVSGILTLIKDPKAIYNASLSTNLPTSVSGDTLKWAFTNLNSLGNAGYWNSFFAGVYLTPSLSANIGDTLKFWVSATVPPNDININNNTYELKIPIVNSYDPNIKEVSPKGEGPNGNIPPSTSQLQYTVHFQNTGNASAINVSVVDTLDANLDLSTFKIEGCSHTMTPEWLAPNVVKFNFNNIYLPDSLSNEPKSHGQLRYHINLKPGLALNTQIKNKALIYFDFNSAIVTNTTKNTLVSPNSISFVNASLNASLFPNPTNSLLHFNVDGIVPANSNITIYNASMQPLIKENCKQKNTLNLESLPNGMYMVKIQLGADVVIRKIIKN